MKPQKEFQAVHTSNTVHKTQAVSVLFMLFFKEEKEKKICGMEDNIW